MTLEIGLKNFQDFFKRNETIDFPLDKLVVRNAAVCIGASPNEVRNEPKLTASRILNFILNPIGVNGRVASGSIDSYSIDGDFIVKGKGFKIVAERTKIVSCVNDIFLGMLASGEVVLQLAPEQEFEIVGLPERKEKYHDFKSTVRVPGYSVQCITPGRYTFSSTETSYKLVCSNSYFFILEPSLSFFTIQEFRTILRLMGRIVVPKGLDLLIFDPHMDQLFKEYDKVVSFAGMLFYLNYMVIGMGKRVKPSCDEFQIHKVVSASTGTRGLKMSADKEFELSLETGPLLLNLAELGNQMLNDRCLALSIDPNQEVIFYDLTPSEMAFLKKNLHDFRTFMLYYLRSRNPISGFGWSTPYLKEIDLTVESTLTLKSETPYEILLKPATCYIEGFITAILIRCSTDFINQVKECSSSVYLYLLYLAIFYFCKISQEKRLDSGWHLFKPETHEALHSLLSKGSFLSQLNRSERPWMGSPDQFDALELDPFLRELKTIAYLELKNSRFLNESLKNITDQLNSDDFTQFLSIKKQIEDLA